MQEPSALQPVRTGPVRSRSGGGRDRSRASAARRESPRRRRAGARPDELGARDSGAWRARRPHDLGAAAARAGARRSSRPAPRPPSSCDADRRRPGRPCSPPSRIRAAIARASASVRTTYGSPIFGDHVPTVRIRWSSGSSARVALSSPSRTRRSSVPGRDVQRGVRPHPQPMEHGADTGRLDGRRRRRARGRRGMARTWFRSCGKPTTPATYCSVVGLRPSPGRVTRGTSNNLFSPLSVQGPMARTVADVALFLDAMADRTRRIAGAARAGRAVPRCGSQPRAPGAHRVERRPRDHARRARGSAVCRAAARTPVTTRTRLRHAAPVIAYGQDDRLLRSAQAQLHRGRPGVTGDIGQRLLRTR